MPYERYRDLPDSVKDSLPEHGQEIYTFVGGALPPGMKSREAGIGQEFSHKRGGTEWIFWDGPS